MSSSEPTSGGVDLDDSLRQAQALGALLEREFDCLKAGDLDGFEQLQAQKADTLEQLSALVPLLTETPESDAGEHTAKERPPLLDQIEETLTACRDAHLRNALLIDRKIASTRSALEVLRSSRAAETGETYDKLGKMKRGYSRGRQADV
jgi:flagellar biosynthesis/type III secretory pathway chaperone